jgi:site-specific DNA-methyltransferase (adenine-specific)
LNRLYYGDNLTVLRDDIPSESVDLIYLDPPFNSQANYNVLFRSPAGEKSHAQIEAFDDTWHWGDEAERAFDDVMGGQNTDAAELLRAFRSFLQENDMMAYLAMMAVRLLELHRVSKPTGSIYLHCDSTASHYLKLLMDAVFGVERYINEIIWQRTSAHGNATRKFAAVHDVLLFYSKSDRPIWNQVFTPYTDAYIDEHFVHLDPDGRRFRRSDLRNPGVRPNLRYDYLASNGRLYRPHPNGWAVSLEVMKELDRQGRLFFPSKEDARLRKKIYLDESPGVPVTDVWADLPPIHASAQERLGYPTQKPIALLERIIAASSNEGDVVLDPFCGCGTTIHAAQKLKREWIGMDIAHLAISLIEKRLNDAFPGIKCEVHGTPKDVEGARALAAQDKYQFQWWAVSLVNAVPFGGKKKGADSGIDGLIYFKPDGKTTEKAIVSVKGGDNVSVAMVRDLGHVVDREKAKMGVFITLADSTGPMRTEAVKAGFYETPYGKFPKLQIATIAELFEGKHPKMPWADPETFKKAAKETEGGTQDVLF